MEWSKWGWHDVVRSWNWEGFDGETLEVHVYNSSESVELFLNDESLGVKETNRENEWIAKWNVPYKPGILKAINYTNGKQVSFDELPTVDTPSRITLSSDRTNITASGQDLCYVTVELVDNDGNRNPTVEQHVEFYLKGPGSIVAVGSSNPMSLESYQKPYRKTYQGRCLVIIRSDKEPGTIQLEATSNGLISNMLTIISE
jgi:beta-galactosidase